MVSGVYLWSHGDRRLKLAKVDKDDPFPRLARPELARRYREVDPPRHVIGIDPATSTAGVFAVDDDGALTSPKVEEAKAAIEAVEAKKRGRPKSGKAKPWDGICSKSQWYRWDDAQREKALAKKPA
jgi:hypothetical protein